MKLLAEGGGGGGGGGGPVHEVQSVYAHARLEVMHAVL